MQIPTFSAPGHFFKGNMHTHSTNSDGAHDVGYVCNAYRERGYDFLVMTDHFMERYGYKVTDSSP